MISFFRQILNNLSSLLISTLCTLLLANVVYSQNNNEIFGGNWTIQVPNKGVLVILAKTQARASYFWASNTDLNVYKGTWTSDDISATFSWIDGSKHHLKRDDFGFIITKVANDGSERYKAKAQQIPNEIIGQWAKPPKRMGETLSDRDKAKGFFGIWKITNNDASTNYIFVESDRSVASTEGGENGFRGSWAKQGSELHITWDSGHYSIIRENKRGFSYKQIPPNTIIEEDQSEMIPAERTIQEQVPSKWITNYKIEREKYDEGIAFPSRKEALAFYRGDWVVQLDNERFERIKITRFGGLEKLARRKLEGEWRLQGQDIFMRWDDGMRSILSPVGRSFVIYQYKPGRPLDGVPSRTRAAAPNDNEKLTKHLKGREKVAKNIIELASAAGMDLSQKNLSGWGRSFARWVWPFNEDEITANTGDILANEYEGTQQNDPWWWPFWSNQSTIQISTIDDPASSDSNGTTHPSKDVNSLHEAETNEIKSPVQAIHSSTKTEKKHSSIRDWAWPF